MIAIEHVNKSFDKHEALQDVSLRINKGSIFGLLGSNGAGKTTLIRMIVGILKQNSGTILMHDQQIYENTEMKQKIAFIPDAPFAFPQYTIKQMADYYKSLYTYWNQERFLALQSTFNISLNKKIHQMSKGMQKQVALWLSLSTMPELLVLDEPLDGLDPVIRAKIKKLIVDDVAERQMTVIISSHNLKEIEDLCDTVAIMHQGKVIVEKDIDDLKAACQKIQIAFKGPFPQEMKEQLNVLHKEKRGSVYLLIIRGEREELEAQLQTYNPILLDLLPLTLEEIFIYEMGDAGYAIQNLV